MLVKTIPMLLGDKRQLSPNNKNQLEMMLIRLLGCSNLDSQLHVAHHVLGRWKYCKHASYYII